MTRGGLIEASQKDPDKQRALVKKVVEKGISSEDIKRDKKNTLNPFIYQTQDGKATVTVKFSKTIVNQETLLGVLREAYLSVKRQGSELTPF